MIRWCRRCWPKRACKFCSFEFCFPTMRQRHSHEQVSLAGSLLLAHPALRDLNFRRSVILMSTHSADGAMGVVLNRPLGKRLGELNGEFALSPLAGVPLFGGGPVEPGQLLLAGDATRWFQQSYASATCKRYTESVSFPDVRWPGQDTAGNTLTVDWFSETLNLPDKTATDTSDYIVQAWLHIDGTLTLSGDGSHTFSGAMYARIKKDGVPVSGYILLGQGTNSGGPPVTLALTPGETNIPIRVPATGGTSTYTVELSFKNTCAVNSAFISCGLANANFAGLAIVK